MYTPSLEEFVKLAQGANLVPITRRLLADFETPLSAYRKIRGQGESFMLESVEGGEHLGRYSFVGCNPRAVIKQIGNRVEVWENGKLIEQHTVCGALKPPAAGEVKDGLAVVERLVKRYHPALIPGLPRFTGGAVGFIGYEFIHDIEPVVPRPPRDELGTPVMYFLLADELLIFDRVTQTITVLVNAVIEENSRPEEVYEEAVSEIERIIALLEQPSASVPLSVPFEIPEIASTSNVSPEKFKANVLKSKEYITAGDIIQVVGSQRFSAPVTASPMDVYRAARTINPSPYMFLLELDGLSLVGASPEIHVRCEEGRVEIRPIAGTRARGKSAEADKALETRRSGRSM
jgi:anthranilate synthase component 1